MTIEINGMAHVILTVSNWEKAHAFYGGLLPFLGLKKVYDGNNFLYHVGGRTAVGIQRCAPEHEGLRFEQNRIGLHHLCLRARNRDDVGRAARCIRHNDFDGSTWISLLGTRRNQARQLPGHAYKDQP